MTIATFEFATAARIIFGAGTLDQIGPIAQSLGARAFVVTGADPGRAAPLLAHLDAAGIAHTVFAVAAEPDIALVDAALARLGDHASDLVISFGGGSAIDAGKAISALATNPGGALRYLEVIGDGQKLAHAPLPFVAIPTTAGTGAEVTRNAVLASHEHRVKVSLRDPAMLPRVALVDPALTHGLPPAITASTGMDALTQVLEPFVSHRANPLTDALCRDGLARVARALRRAYHDGDDIAAREDMALASLFGGLALANAKLGAVHGFAGPLGGMLDGAPHGAICARLLPPCTAINVAALRARDATHPALARYDEAARILTGDPAATADDAVAWIAALAGDLDIAPLRTYGLTRDDFPAAIEKAERASSMQGNPLTLTRDELATILERAL